VEYPRKIVKGTQEPVIKIETISTVKDQKTFVQRLELTTQCFTHIDAPIHFFEDGISIDEVPFDQLINDAVVIDMMHKKPGECVTFEDLEESHACVQEGDTIIIRTGWTDRAWGTRQFWEEMIYLDESAADWIVSKKPKALMQDFMTDIKPLRKCEHCGQLVPQDGEYCPNHFKFLGRGIILIEWCTNLGAIKQQRVKVMAIPLKIKGADGSPSRVIVIEKD
jgi:kynurenine formamidase